MTAVQGSSRTAPQESRQMLRHFLGLMGKSVFTALVLMNIGLILVNRSFHSSLLEAVMRPNPTLWVLVTSVLIVLAAALYWPPGQALFHFGALHMDDLAFCLGAGLGLLVVLETGKRLAGMRGKLV